MTYTPTKEELEELGFEDKYTLYYELTLNNVRVHYYYGRGFSISLPLAQNAGFDFIINVQSLEDIKTLIRLLTPSHE